MKALKLHLKKADDLVGNLVNKKAVRRYASIFMGLFLVICAIVIAVLSIKSNQNFWRLPLSYEISMPQFTGRIKPQSQIHPGTFTVEVDFSETSKWGLMSYGVGSNAVNDKNGYAIWSSGVVIEAWRPDPKTAGVYEYAVKFIPSRFPSDYNIKKVSLNRGRLRVDSAFDEDDVLTQIVLNIFFGGFSFYFLIYGLSLIAKNLKRRSIAPAQT